MSSKIYFDKNSFKQTFLERFHTLHALRCDVRHIFKANPLPELGDQTKIFCGSSTAFYASAKLPLGQVECTSSSL